MKKRKMTLIKLRNRIKNQVKVRREIKITTIKMITTNSIKKMEENHLKNQKEKKKARKYLNIIPSQ